MEAERGRKVTLNSFNLDSWMAQLKEREVQDVYDAIFRSDLKEFSGKISIEDSRGGMGDSPGAFTVSVETPDNFWKGGYRWDIKKGVKDQFNGKKVTVIVHD